MGFFIFSRQSYVFYNRQVCNNKLNKKSFQYNSGEKPASQIAFKYGTSSKQCGPFFAECSSVQISQILLYVCMGTYFKGW